jgi:hypothetical protein
MCTVTFQLTLFSNLIQNAFFLPINLYMSSSKILISANKKESFFLVIEQLSHLEHSLLLPECSVVFLGVELFKEDEKEVVFCSKEVERTPPNLPLSSERDNSSNCIQGYK